jgi:diguanylate cyclase (GGDEF)-like protein
MQWKFPTLARVVNHWSMNTDTMGVYGNYYLKRAIVAQVGLGANLPEDAIYPVDLGDENGAPLDGANKYSIHFDKGAAPPVNAFWSITLYDLDGFQVANSLNRFAVSSWMPFKYNKVTEREQAEARAQYLVTHDNLTGLPNRLVFGQALSDAVKVGRRYGRTFAVMFVDLDRFKVINDTLGHTVGDSVLIDIANRLMQCVRESDVVARFGGDEFIILLREVSDASQVTTVARKILSTVVKPLTIHGQAYRVTASIGISMFPSDAEDEESLTKNADVAMHAAKEESRNNFRFYSQEIKTQSIERMMIETSLERALERNELLLYYQPKQDLSRGGISGVEALLRWNHPDLGLLPPGRFISIAEETGLIVPIGKWVLETACAQNMAWQRQGLSAIRIAVNLSPRQFADPNLLDDIRTALEKSGMPPQLLELEITESMVMQNFEHTMQRARRDQEPRNYARNRRFRYWLFVNVAGQEISDRRAQD